MQPGSINNSFPRNLWPGWSYLGVGLFFCLGNLVHTSLWRMVEAGSWPHNLAIAVSVIWSGTLIGQLLLLSLLGVFDNSRSYIRLPKTILAGLVLVGTFWIGYWFVMRGRSDFLAPEPSVMIVLALMFPPPLILMAQIPLWIAKLGLGWRVVRQDVDRRASLPSQFSIADMMVATLVVALIAGSWRWSLVFLEEDNPWDLLSIMLYFGVLLLLVTLFGALPAVYGILRPRKVASGLAGLGVYCLFWGTVAIVFVAMTGGTTETIFIQLGILGGLTSSLLVPLLIARSQGYRLIWWRETEYPQASVETWADKKASG